MQPKLDADASTAAKAIRLFQKLLFQSGRHYLGDLAKYLNCSAQTVMRLIGDIELIIGTSLLTGMDKHRRWYEIRSISRNRLGLDYEELRYLSICRDLAEPYLSEQVRKRVDESIFKFSVLMADHELAMREQLQKAHIGHCAKGRIDYTPFFGFMEKIVQAMDKELICIVWYKSPHSKIVREHKFAPHRIVSMNNALYALGALVSEDMNEIRHLTNLAIHRIHDVVLTDKKREFSIPAEDLDMFGLPWHGPRRFRIKFSGHYPAEYVSERIWSDKQRSWRDENGDLILEMVSCSEPEVLAWVRSFGRYAELLAIEDTDESCTGEEEP